MGNKLQIILSGIGGQGVIASGGIIAQTAIEKENLYATLSSSYGVESRGTFTKSDIIVSEKQIYYTEVLKADLVLAMAQVAYNRYVSSMEADTIFIYDSTMVTDIKECKAKQLGYEFTDMARDLGNVMVANIIALGVIIKLTGMLPESSIIENIENMYSGNAKVRDLNVKAFKKGLEIA